PRWENDPRKLDTAPDSLSSLYQNSSLSISHMFYADDAVFVGQWCDGALVDSDKVKCVASKFGCLILKTPFSYLGSKVGGSMSRVYTWNEAIHGDDGKVGGYVKDGAKSCWLSIVNEINSLKNKGINLILCMLNWGIVIKQLFGRIFGLKTSLDSSFRRVPRGGVEQEQFDELSALVYDVTLTPMSDIWISALESSGDFSVASVRKVIDDKSLPEVDYKTRWIKYVPIKVNVHAWKVKTDSLSTRYNVSRRGIHIDSIMCAICDKWAETSSHLFFSCCMSRQTVRMITRWWDVPYGEIDSYEDWINWFVNLRLLYKHKQMLEGVFYVKWWLLWKFRNKLMFDSIPPSQALFFDDVVSMSFHWCRYRCKASFSWNDCLKHPRLVTL
nr:RNA-directed DNA polymerase, eukaryota [Tanacetum cinerariifolium]